LRSLNTFRRWHSRSRLLLPGFLGVFAAVHVASPRVANGQSKPLSQYLQEEWGSEKGFPGGTINVIAQTPDGYLWMGTQKGLVRFDGRNFRLLSLTTASGNSFETVLGLLSDGEGNLWVRLQGARILRYRDGNFEEFTSRFDIPEVAVTQMCLGPDGRAIFATILNGIVVFDHGKFTGIASPSHFPNFVVTSMVLGADGTYWLGTRDLGLFRLREGRISAAREVLSERQINALLSQDAKHLWIGTDKGLLLWNGVELTQIGNSSSLRSRQILSLSEDPDGNIWVGTDRGVYRLDPESNFTPKTENTQDDIAVTAIFTDREGNVWTGTPRGLLRLRNTVFTTYDVSNGLPSDSNGSVHVDTDGRIWFAPMKGGLYWLKDGVVEIVREAGLERDVVYSIAGGNGNLWVGRQLGGLTHLQNISGKWQGVTYTKADGLAQNSVYTVQLTHDGAVWAGTLSAGLTRIKNGKFDTFTTENGLISNTVASIIESRSGTMWFATPRGLSGFSNNRWASYSEKDGLPSDDVVCLFEDSAGTLWIGTMNGLAAFRSGKIWTPSQGPDLLREPIFGIQEDSEGFLWISTSNHIGTINREKVFRTHFNAADVREFGIADGLRGTDGVKRDGAVGYDGSGKMWFSMNRGLSSVDTHRVRAGSPPSLLHLEGLSVDGVSVSVKSPISISPNPQRITISYSGLSLSAPERVKYKYKLDGFDKTWSEALTNPEANYTNLNADSYLFHVVASNSDGQWSSTELTIPFTIEPVFWNTWWFRVIAAFVLALLILTLVRLRVSSLTQQLNVRFEERLGERTRIAQELHDTLLQGLLSASMQLHVANEQLAAESPAKPLVNRVLQLMGRVVDEGRNAVRGLRSSSHGSVTLEQAFSAIPQELAIEDPASLRVIVEGIPRKLQPSIRDEIYLVGREGLVNALRHSGAREIEIEIEYAADWLHVNVSDDGSGINPQTLREGRDGHWGLSGMRERAERIGAKLRLLSRASAGTRIELSIPGSIVYQPEFSDRRSKFLNMFRLRSLRPQMSEKTDSQEQR
jgi:ligand-binding sensor domain-containing protein/signal transduction histidine kinase